MIPGSVTASIIRAIRSGEALRDPWRQSGRLSLPGLSCRGRCTMAQEDGSSVKRGGCEGQIQVFAIRWLSLVGPHMDPERLDNFKLSTCIPSRVPGFDPWCTGLRCPIRLSLSVSLSHSKLGSEACLRPSYAVALRILHCCSQHLRFFPVSSSLSALPFHTMAHMDCCSRCRLCFSFRGCSLYRWEPCDLGASGVARY